MNSFKLFLLLGALALCSGSNANEYAALLDDLFEDEDYDPRAIPLEKPPQSSSDNSNAINVGVGLNILDLLLNQEYGTLASNAWLMLKWNDFRLMWDPDQYDGLKSIRVPNDIIWKPDIALYNLAYSGPDDMKRQIVSSPYNAIVAHDGTVVYVPAINMDVDCSDDAPWNSDQEEFGCHIKLGSWTYDGNHINITTYKGNEPKLTLEWLSYRSHDIVIKQEGSEIVSKYYSCCEEPYMHIDFKFTVMSAGRLGPEKVTEMVKSVRKN